MVVTINESSLWLILCLLWSWARDSSNQSTLGLLFPVFFYYLLSFPLPLAFLHRTTPRSTYTAVDLY